MNHRVIGKDIIRVDSASPYPVADDFLLIPAMVDGNWGAGTDGDC